MKLFAGKQSPRWFWLSLGLFVLDQATKALVSAFTPEGYLRPIIPGFFSLVHTRNRGIAFGMLSGVESRWFDWALIAGTAAVILFLIWLLATGRGGVGRTQIGFALILGGAAGNLTDRLVHGRVIDFIELYFRSYHWPAFNVADSAISIGAVLLAVDLLFARSPR